MDEEVFIGLSNIGNSCYLDASLSILYTFRRHLLACLPPSNPVHRFLSAKTPDAAALAQSQSLGFLRSRGFFRGAGAHNQHDAAECLAALLQVSE